MSRSRLTRLSSYRPTNTKIGLITIPTAAVATFAGYLVLRPVLESGFVLLFLFCGLFYYLSRQEYPSEVAARGLYVLAIFALLYAPIYFFGLLLAPTDPEGGALWMADAVYTLIIRGPVGTVVALVFAGVGYLFDQQTRNSQQENSREHVSD